jgi:hypothetical protein
VSNPIMVVVVGDTEWEFDREAIRDDLEPLGLAGPDGLGEVSVHSTGVAVRADPVTTTDVIARLRALAPPEVVLMCFDEAYTSPEFELAPGVDADRLARQLYQD